MIVGTLNAWYGFLGSIISLVPSVGVTMPNIAAALPYINGWAPTLLPMDHVKAAGVIWLAFWGARLALVPVRWLLVGVRGVNPG